MGDTAGQLAAQHAVMRVLAESETVREALEKLLPAICAGTGWDLGAAWRLDEHTDVLRCEAFWHAPAVRVPKFEALTRGTAFSPGIGLPGRVWSSRAACRIPDVVEDPNFPRGQTAAEEGLHGAFGLPIRVGGDVFGVLEFFACEARTLGDELLRTMDTIGGQIGLFVHRLEAQEAVRHSEARKAAILEASLDCVITIDHNGKIVETNPAVERVFGFRQTELLGREMGELMVPPSLREAHRSGLARCHATGKGPVIDRRLELTALRKDGVEFPIELTVTQIRTAGPPMFTGYVRDLTEVHRTENEIRLAERRLKVLLGCTKGIVFEFDRDGRYVQVWTNSEALLTLPRTDLLGKTIAEVLGADAAEPFTERIERVFATGQPETFEYALDVMAGTSWFLADAFVAPTEPGASPTVVFHVRDNTERKRAEQTQTRLHEQLQTLSRRFLMVQEAERRHIARELHDELGQVLTGLKLVLETAARLPHDAAIARIAEALELVLKLIGQVRALSLDLRPLILDEGLLPALKGYFEQHVKQALAVSFVHTGLDGRRFAPELETAAYRIVQEALTNVVRHAAVPDVTVSIQSDSQSMHVRVEDRGAGFDAASMLTARNTGGLAGMQERATLLGGRLTIDSAPGHGTRLSAELPLGEPGAATGAG